MTLQVSPSGNTGRDFPVIGIGASAGGVKALTALFGRLPPHPQATFLVITHLAPNRDSMLPDILGRCTQMPVVAASHGIEVEPGHAYVLPPDTILTIADDRLALTPRGEERNVIDACLASLAEDAGERAVAVILSGTGADGAIGVKAVRAAGGFTLAQATDGSSPSYHGMPDAAIATGFVDCVLPVENLADRVAAFIDAFGKVHPEEAGDEAARRQLEDAKRELFALLRSRVGHDFSGYKQSTFLRRVERRMHVQQVRDIPSYLQIARTQPEELDTLFRDLLIGVTAFFRDFPSFEALGNQVVPRLLRDRTDGNGIRVWVPGCATGEEAYSIAIMLLERLNDLEKPPRLQVFATDVDEKALAVARAGRYPARLLTSMSPERLERFFVAEGSSYVVAKALRETCLFSCHSLIRDPPFSRMDLISCRNLLIYLDADLQNQIIPLFHYALRPEGMLFLGSSEHIGQHAALFSPLDKRHRVFLRRDLPSRPTLFPSFRSGAAGRTGTLADGATPARQEAARRCETVVLERYAPAHVIIDRDGEILHYSVRTGKYLEAPAGAPSRNLLAMARSGLRLVLRSVLHEVAETNRRVTRERVTIEVASGSQTVDLTAEPLPNSSGERYFLVVFTDVGPVTGHDAATVAESSTGRDDDYFQVEQELRQTREQLQSLVEEYQSSVEELKSSNEEMLSVNEELQSSNEELETSKEELQSVNEELHTVNAELVGKIEQLDRANSDLKNLFDSTQIATVFLDGKLLIRSYTPATAKIFKLIPGDCGRPLSDIVSYLAYDDLADDVAAVLGSGQPREKKLVSRDGLTHYLMRVLPYRTTEGVLDGVLVTYVDVTPLAELGEQQALVAELNHRVKNILAVVSSMAVQMARRCKTKEDFAEAFVSRIEGLAKTHDILSINSWGDVGLRELVAGELKAFVADPDRVAITGPNVLLQPRVATTLGIIVHELATNALKYGAFANAEGHLTVTWAFESLNGARHLVVRWRELGGPLTRPPERKGFGTELIERSLDFELGGLAALDFRTEGLVATLAIPADEIAITEAQHGV